MILCACTGWSKSAHFAHTRRQFFALRSLFIKQLQSVGTCCETKLSLQQNAKIISLWFVIQRYVVYCYVPFDFTLRHTCTSIPMLRRLKNMLKLVSCNGQVEVSLEMHPNLRRAVKLQDCMTYKYTLRKHAYIILTLINPTFYKVIPGFTGGINYFFFFYFFSKT